MMKPFTDNKSYCKYLFKIVHTHNVKDLKDIEWDMCCDENISFDMMNDLGNLIDERIALFS